MDLRKNASKARLKRELAKEAISPEEKRAYINKAMKFVFVGHSMLVGADVVLRRAFGVLTAVKPFLQYNDSWNAKRNIEALEAVLKRMEVGVDNMDDKVFANCGVDAFTTVRRNANEMLRFVMLMYDRTLGNMDNTDKISAFIQSLESSGTFADEEIADMRMD